MASGEGSIRVGRPPDEVFAVVGDAANNPRWRTAVVRTEWLDDGPMRRGRRGRQTARYLGREWTVEAEVDVWDPPHRVAWRTVTGPLAVRSGYDVKPDGDGTMLRGWAEGGFRGPLGRLLDRLVVPGLRRQAQADLRALREHLETAQPEADPG